MSKGSGEPLTSVMSESMAAESEARRTTLVTSIVGSTSNENVTATPLAVADGEIDSNVICDSANVTPSIPMLKSVAGPPDATRCLDSSLNSPNCSVDPCTNHETPI